MDGIIATRLVDSTFDKKCDGYINMFYLRSCYWSEALHKPVSLHETVPHTSMKVIFHGFI